MENGYRRKPDWLKSSLGNNDTFAATGKIVRDHRLHTICQSGRCPNLGECWNSGVATFMIAGDICTRSCKFCNTKTGKPLPLNPDEPAEIAEAVSRLRLKHAVITSVDRDDLPDCGAHHWAETIERIKQRNPATTVETLIPDFNGNHALLDLVVHCAPDIISHNMETTRRLTPTVRSVARYDTSLAVLSYVASTSAIPVKSGFMLGLGETADEIMQLMDDLLAAGCRLLSIGQYLQPSRKSLPVQEYLHPDRFKELKQTALEKGFSRVESAPFVRSSYHSQDFLQI
ncbi:MAG: lipoyl synthase [Dysgonamonadaceae bacterium]|jgi:lipoic acid synthetase|nr:lipoyl synthase [Dysgonamonadaceae bacterium]